MRSWLLVIVITAVMAGAATADVPPDKTVTPRPEGSGKAGVPGLRGKTPILGDVEIGERAPDFVLDGSKGREEQLSRQRGQWALLVFADRYRTLAVFDTLATNGLKLGVRVIGVCHEKQQTLTVATARDHVDMLLLADPTGEVSAVFGLYDWGESRTQPGFFVLDAEGIVRLAVVGRLFPADEMLDLLRFATGASE